MTAPVRPLEFAAALTQGAPLPSRRLEGWKWTDLQKALRTLPPESPEAAITVGQGAWHGLAEDELLFVNGRGPGETVRLERDLALRFVSDAQGTGHRARLRLEVPAGASATLFESYEGRGAYFANTLLEIVVGEGARLERIVRVAEAASAIAVSTCEITLAPDAKLLQTVLSSGAKLQRHETHVHHPGAGAEVRLDGLYILSASDDSDSSDASESGISHRSTEGSDSSDGASHADLTTVVIHEGPGGTTRELVKGVVGGRARGVFQGRITVLEGADQTDARMGHHALVLSDRAEVDAKPELEIWADDVQCAHGNTVGSLDQNALFYAQSRGIPEPEARALLTEAFLGEVVDRIEHEGGREAARAWLTRRLGR